MAIVADASTNTPVDSRLANGIRTYNTYADLAAVTPLYFGEVALAGNIFYRAAKPTNAAYGWVRTGRPATVLGTLNLIVAEDGTPIVTESGDFIIAEA